MKKWAVFMFLLVLLIAGYSAAASASQVEAAAQVRQALPPVLAGQAAAQETSISLRDTILYMHIGSPVALADGKLLSLDKESPDLAPVIHQTRTMVPLRVISEYFGAEVRYDPDAAQASIDTGSHKAVFPIGKAYYFFDGEQRPLDAGSLLISGRVFVPLREICQETLGYTVDFRDGLICIAKEARLTDSRVQEVKSRIGMYVRAGSLEELNKYLQDAYVSGYYHYRGEVTVADEVPLLGGDDAFFAGSAGSSAANAAPAPFGLAADQAESMPAFASDTGAGSASSNYSTTNIQVAGVDEGDIIKTDGKYIYIVAGSHLKIVDALNMKLTGEYALGQNRHAQEMYVDKDRVVIVGNRYESSYLRQAPGATVAPDADFMPGMYFRGTNYTFVSVLDTTDPAAIKEFRYYEVEGDMTASRKKGDYVYLVSGFNRWYRTGGGDLRPLAGENGDLSPMPLERIMIMPGCYADSFLTLSAINIRNINEKVNSETIAGAGYITYMSNNNLYLALNDWRYSDRETMNIARFSIDGAKIGYAGSGGVAGSLNDQFSMDEYNGHLRVATSVLWPKSYNNLYVIDGNMDVKGRVTGYAEGERIYSARFMGDRGYVVTFREVDPLFVFDLSDPAAPKITGELKVPGFSTYLHPVSQNVLLGVGRDVYDLFREDAQGNKVVVGQQTGGVKISLFDVSDMGKPREIDTLVLGDHGDTDLLYNHKAAMFKADDGLLGFCGSSSTEMGGRFFQGAFLISYAGDKLSETGCIEYENPYAYYSKNDDLLYTGQRLVYIGNTLYYMQDGLLRSFDFRTLAPKTSLRLTTPANLP